MSLRLEAFGDGLFVIAARLPKHLHFGVGFEERALAEHTLVERSGAKATADNENGFHIGTQTERPACFGLREGGVEQVLSHRVTGE